MGASQTKLTPGRPWADSPFQLLETPRKKANLPNPKSESGAFRAATEMTHVHNFIIRGLNSIYLQAPNIRTVQDRKDFLVYMHAWSILIHMHHDNEEAFIFPILEEMIGVKGFMEKNIDQHKLFHSGLLAFDEYVKSARAGTEEFDGVKIRAIIDSFGQVLTSHLTDEIETFLALDNHKVDWKKYQAEIEAKALKAGDMEYEIPFVVVHYDLTHEAPAHDGYPPLVPWYVRQFLRWVYVPKHKAAWRFAPCDDNSRPRDLPFV